MSEQNYKGIWEDVLNIIREEYKQKNQENFFKIYFNMEYVSDTIDEITVSVPSDVMLNHMEEKGSIQTVKDKIAEITGINLNVKFIPKNITSKLPASDSNLEEEKTEAIAKETPSVQTEPQPENPYTSILNNLISESEKESKIKEDSSSSYSYSSDEKPVKKHLLLDENFTFETFVPGENSNFAYNVSIGVAKEPGKKFNPLLIYGGSGLGKTHLMQSIGNYIYKQKEGNVKIACLSAENFTNEFFKSLSDKKTDQFKNKFRKLDVLLLDDIHFLIDKKGTQEELFHTFEALHQKKAQMVFTCDRSTDGLYLRPSHGRDKGYRRKTQDPLYHGNLHRHYSSQL